MRDQADDLRRLVRLRLRSTDAASPKLLVVAGGQPGVGTTTAAVNLAASLARLGRRTVLVDADLYSSGNRGAADGDTILDLLSGRRGVHEVMQRGAGGVQVVCGAWAPAEAARLSGSSVQRLIADLLGLTDHADAVVVDAGCGRDELARRLWRAADLLLMVTTPETGAVMDAYAALKVLLDQGGAAALCTLVNRADDEQVAADVARRIAGACRRFLGRSVELAGFVPDAGAAIGANDEPLVERAPRSAAALALERVAEFIWVKVATDDDAQALDRRAGTRLLA